MRPPEDAALRAVVPVDGTGVAGELLELAEPDDAAELEEPAELGVAAGELEAPEAEAWRSGVAVGGTGVGVGGAGFSNCFGFGMMISWPMRSAFELSMPLIPTAVISFDSTS